MSKVWHQSGRQILKNNNMKATLQGRSLGIHLCGCFTTWGHLRCSPWAPGDGEDCTSIGTTRSARGTLARNSRDNN